MNAVARVCVITFSAAIGAILLSAVLVTSAISHGNAQSLRLPFRLLCHGRAERCLRLWNTPMPICSRCVGIYAGALVALAVFSATSRRWTRELTSRTAVLLMVPLVVDGVTQALGVRESTSGLRVVTGLVAGLAGMAWVLSRLPRQLTLREAETGDGPAQAADLPP